MKLAETLTQWAKFCLLLTWAVLPIAISWQVVYGPAHFRGYLDEKFKPVESWAGGTAKKVDGILESTRASVDDNHDATIAITRSSAATLRHLDGFVIDLGANVNGGEDSQGVLKAGLITKFQSTIGVAQSAIEESQADIHTLLVTGNKSAEALNQVLTNASSLTATLEAQVKEGSPKVQETIVALTKTLTDLDALVADPNLKQTLTNVNTTTYHLGESAKSLDTALQKLREKVGLIKTALKMAVGMLKFTIPIP